VLQNVGLDKDSGQLWADYIAFLKTAEAKGTYEEQQKMDTLRKTYHRALSVPIANIEQLWRDYEAYENSLSRMTAKKFIADRSSGYMLARTGQKELKILMEPLEGAMKGWLAKPPGWSEKECQLVGIFSRPFPLKGIEADRIEFTNS
jgi:cleavage stimulation factor subunit 3